MKKVVNILSIVVIMLGVSCSESFLDLQPPSNPDVNSLYKADIDFKQAVNGVYAELQTYYKDFWQFSELRADNADHIWTSETYKRIDQFYMLATDGILNSTWSNIYNSILRSNIILEKLEITNPDLVPNMNQYKAEALYLRGLNYFNLVRVWGEVPLVLKTLSPEEGLDFPQSNVEDIYNSIIADLQFSQQNLPASYSGNDIGRATKGAAASLLGKVYLTIGDFQKAESTLAEVMGMGYSLLTDYNSVFDHYNEHHTEYIFDIEYEPDLSGEGSPFSNTFYPNHPEFRNFYHIVGNVGETLTPTEEYFGLFDPDDIRLSISAVRGFTQDDGSFFKTTLAYTQKYLTPINTGNDSRVNWKIIRFADVILMYAEALNENGKTNLALNELNKIRVRAGVAEFSGLSQAETRDAIDKERRLELGFEGHRWFDLLRTGKAFEIMSANGYNIEPYHVLFAKPQQQLDVVNNISILSQNPGY